MFQVDTNYNSVTCNFCGEEATTLKDTNEMLLPACEWHNLNDNKKQGLFVILEIIGDILKFGPNFKCSICGQDLPKKGRLCKECLETKPKIMKSPIYD